MAVGATSVTVQGWSGGLLGTEPSLTDDERRLDILFHRHTHRGKALVVFLTGQPIPCREAVFSRDTVTVTDRDGKITVIRWADTPPRRFPLSKSLTEGGVGDSVNPGLQGTAYRVADLRVGDEVALDLEWDGNRKVCARIKIERRPGGRVPPAAREEPIEGQPRYHEWMNILQDWEAGAPISDQHR